MNPLHPDRRGLRDEVDAALARLGRLVNLPLSLDAHGRCSVQIGAFKPVTFEWVEQARCLAVYAPWSVASGGGPAAEQLLALHAAGAYSLGTSFWRLPDGRLRVGQVLCGPRLDEDHLLEAAGRVVKMVARLEGG